MLHMFGAIIVGALTGYISERLGLTRNGIVISIALGVGGAIILWFAQGFMDLDLTCVRFGSPEVPKLCKTEGQRRCLC